MKKIKVYDKGAYIEPENSNTKITFNDAKYLGEVPATSKNVKKYVKEGKFRNYLDDKGK